MKTLKMAIHWVLNRTLFSKYFVFACSICPLAIRGVWYCYIVAIMSENSTLWDHCKYTKGSLTRATLLENNITPWGLIQTVCINISNSLEYILNNIVIHIPNIYIRCSLFITMLSLLIYLSYKHEFIRLYFIKAILLLAGFITIAATTIMALSAIMFLWQASYLVLSTRCGRVNRYGLIMRDRQSTYPLFLVWGFRLYQTLQLAYRLDPICYIFGCLLAASCLAIVLRFIMRQGVSRVCACLISFTAVTIVLKLSSSWYYNHKGGNLTTLKSTVWYKHPEVALIETGSKQYDGVYTCLYRVCEMLIHNPSLMLCIVTLTLVVTILAIAYVHLSYKNMKFMFYNKRRKITSVTSDLNVKQNCDKQKSK